LNYFLYKVVTTIVEADEAIVEQLMSMGFSQNGSKRAALAVNNSDAETAMNWIFEHMEDPNFNEPIAPPSIPLNSNSNNVSGFNSARSAVSSLPIIDPEVVAMLSSMGYTDEQTRAALIATDNNIER
jgi:ubiquitin carboxyl-terminal hydrolase 5/13